MIYRIAPPGYVACGDVAVNSLDKPSTNMIWCLRADLTRAGAYSGSDLWDDRGSGRPTDVSIWSVIPESVGITGSEKFVYSTLYFLSFWPCVCRESYNHLASQCGNASNSQSVQRIKKNTLAYSANH